MNSLEPIAEASDEGSEEVIGDDYDLMINFQKILTSLSEDNFSQAKEFFKSSPLHQNQDLLLLITDEVLSAFFIRTKNIQIIARFCLFLKANEGFEEIFLSTIFKPESDLREIDQVITRTALLRECLIQNFTKIETIITYMNAFRHNHSNNPEQLYIYFVFFAPEIETFDIKIFLDYSNFFSIFDAKCRSPQALQIYQQFTNLRSNSWRQLYESIQFGAPLCSVQAALKRDDVEAFKGLGWSVNARIDKAPFEIHPAAQCSLLPLQYAALFGAQKCVEYILSEHPMIMADETEESYQYERTEAIYDGKDSPEYERSVAYALAVLGGASIADKFKELNFPATCLHSYAAAYRLPFVPESDNSTDDLFDAVRHNNIQCVLDCIDTANLTVGKYNNMTPAHIAALFGHSYVLQIVYGKLKDMQAEDQDDIEEDDDFAPHTPSPLVPNDFFGRQPIHLAALSGQFDVVQVLMTLGCNPDQPDNFGRTCLSLAAMNGHAAIVNFLLGEGVNPNPKDHDGLTPLLLAVTHLRPDACEALVQNPGVDVTVTAEFGVNALHIAAQTSNIDIFTILMESKRFDIQSKDMIGRTILDFVQDPNMLVAARKFLPSNQTTPSEEK